MSKQIKDIITKERWQELKLLLDIKTEYNEDVETACDNIRYQIAHNEGKIASLYRFLDTFLMFKDRDMKGYKQNC